MFNLIYLLTAPFGYYDYIWVDVAFIKETPKAILVMFDGKKEWLPKAWIVRFKRSKNRDAIKIKISQYHWAKKIRMIHITLHWLLLPV